MKVTDKEGVGNRLLSALSAEEYDRVRPHLTRVELLPEQIIHYAEIPVSYVYFPETAALAYVYNTEEGVPLEVGTIANNGLAGVFVALGTRRTPNQTEVLIGGTALRLSANVMQAEAKRGGALSELVYRYAQATMVNAGQMQVCMRHHSLEERLACWLLLIYDSNSRKALPLTQAAIGQMLGVRRGGVSSAANHLQAKGLIKYSRGKLTILDREALVEFACRCFKVVSEEYESVFSEQSAGYSTSQTKYPDPRETENVLVRG
jgi:CRP-like cAMP-binding protein